MIAWLKAVLSWFGECKRLKAENARKERQLIAAVQSPDAAPELVEQATLYFMGKDTKSIKEARNGSSKTRRPGVA